MTVHRGMAAMGLAVASIAFLATAQGARAKHTSGEGHGVRRTRAARQAPHRPRYRLSMCRCWVRNQAASASRGGGRQFHGSSSLIRFAA